MSYTDISQKVFLDRYALKDSQGSPLEAKPEEMWRRVADAVASVEGKNKKKWSTAFYDAMSNFKFVPGGRILAGAGSGFAVTFYNCFVIPSPRDSRDGILKSLEQMIEIMARGGGVGINMSSLRPKGSRVEKVNGFSSGPCNWAELFSLATKDIIQQGGTRRGALMLMLWDWHPDIEDFITVKQDLTRINGANLSVCVSDAFMEAVKHDGDWDLVFPDKKDPDYDEVWDGDIKEWMARGKKVNVVKTVKARKLWNLISEAAWRSAEPGIVFMERYNKMYNNYYWNKIVCTNPCGEEGLPPWGVCNLGSINLSAFVHASSINEPGIFDFDMLKKTVHTAVRFLDNVVDMDPYVFEGIRETQLKGERRIGLGTMGLGDALIKMHIRYGSVESLRVIESIYGIICNEAYLTSSHIAVEKGSFEKFDKAKFVKSGFVQTLPQDVQRTIKKQGIRNSLLLMQAPTGSTSLMANTTSGIEPVYEFEFTRHDRLGTHTIRHHLYQQWHENHSDEIEKGSIVKPHWFVSANDLSPEDHVMVQAAIQKYVDASISKTVNAPSTHTVEDVRKLYMLAYEHGLKGIAYMRDGSRQGVLERKIENGPDAQNEKQEPIVAIMPRPMVVHGSTYEINTPVGKAYVTINVDENNDPFEVFVNAGKAGTDLYAMAAGIGRIISLMFRMSSLLPPHERVCQVIQKLEGIGGGNTIGYGKNRVRSLPDAIAKVLSMHFRINGYAKDEVIKSMLEEARPHSSNQTVEHQLTINQAQRSHLFDICPKCGEFTYAREEGCKKCYACGHSEC